VPNRWSEVKANIVSEELSTCNWRALRGRCGRHVEKDYKGKLRTTRGRPRQGNRHSIGLWYKPQDGETRMCL
jgi:hypothetical protein